MPTSLRTLLIFGTALLAPANASAQFGGGSLRGTSVGLAFNSPIGDFADLAKTGFGIAIRRSSGSDDEAWSLRSSISFDRFTGADSLDNAQFIGFGGDILHRSRPNWYQFGGFGLYSTTRNDKPSGQSASTSLSTRKEQNFGVSGGVGVNLGSGDVKPFVELSAVLVWGATSNYTWFPVRAGVKF